MADNHDYVSGIYEIPFTQELVYSRLADLKNLEKIKEALNNPQVMERLQHEADKHKAGDISQKLKDIEFTTDTLTAKSGPIGALTLRIIEREEPKTIKMQGEGMPIATNLWIQLLPTSSSSCKMRLTLRADLNMFLRGIMGKKLQEGVDGIAKMLSALPYNVL